MREQCPRVPRSDPQYRTGFANNRVVLFTTKAMLICVIMETQDLQGSGRQGQTGNGSGLKPGPLTDEAVFGYPRPTKSGRSWTQARNGILAGSMAPRFRLKKSCRAS
jgi:hypothetical protein